MQSASKDNDSEEYAVHYVVPPRQKSVVFYDTFEDALDAAFKKVRKGNCSDVWISDASKRVLMNAAQIKAKLAQTPPDQLPS